MKKKKNPANVDFVCITGFKVNVAGVEVEVHRPKFSHKPLIYILPLHSLHREGFFVLSGPVQEF